MNRVPSIERQPQPPSPSVGGRNNFSLSQYYQAKLSGGITKPPITNGTTTSGTATQPNIIPTTTGANAAPTGQIHTGTGAPPHRPIPRGRVGSPSTNTNSPLPLSQFHLPARHHTGPPTAGIQGAPGTTLGLSTTGQPGGHIPLGLRTGTGVEGDLYRDNPFDPSQPSPLPTMHFPLGSMLGHGISPMPSHMYSYANHPNMQQPLTPLGGYTLNSPFSSHFNSPLPTSSSIPASANAPTPDATQSSVSASAPPPTVVKTDPAPTTSTESSSAPALPASNPTASADGAAPAGETTVAASTTDAPAGTNPPAAGTTDTPTANNPPSSSVLDMSALSGGGGTASTVPAGQTGGSSNGNALAAPLISPPGGVGGMYSNMFHQMSYPNSPLTQTPMPMYHAQDSTTVTPMPFYLQRPGPPNPLGPQSVMPGGITSMMQSGPSSSALHLRPPSSGNVVSPVPLHPGSEWQQMSQMSQLQSLQQQLSQMVQSNDALAKQYDQQGAGAIGGPPGRQVSPAAQQQPPLDGSPSFPLPVHPSPSSLLQSSANRGSGYYGGMPQQPSPVPLFPSPQPNNLSGVGGAGIPNAPGSSGASSSSEGEYQALQRLQYQLTMQLKQQQEQLHQQAMQIQYQQQQHSLYMQQLQRQQHHQQQSLFPNSAVPYNGSSSGGGPPFNVLSSPPQQGGSNYFASPNNPNQRNRPFDPSLNGGRGNGSMMMGMDDPRMRQDFKYTESPGAGRLPTNASSPMDQFSHLGNMDLTMSRGGSTLPSPYQPQRQLGMTAPQMNSPEIPERSVRPQVISSQASLVAAATGSSSRSSTSSFQPDRPVKQERERDTKPPAAAASSGSSRGRHGAPPSRHLASKAPEPPPLRMQMPTFLPEPIIITTGTKKTATKFYPCAFAGCAELLKTRFSLKRHMKKHTGEKPHVCPYDSCGKSFPEASTLKRHLRIHTGEKPFKCSFTGCQKAFADATNVKRHEMTHTGEKPYRCLMLNCPRSFSRGSSLRQHMITLHKLAPNDTTLLASVKRGRLMKMKKKRLRAGEVLEEEAAKGNGVGAILAQHGIEFGEDEEERPTKKAKKAKVAPPPKKRKTSSATSRPVDPNMKPARSSARIKSEAHQLKKRKRHNDDDDEDEDEENESEDDSDEEEEEQHGHNGEDVDAAAHSSHIPPLPIDELPVDEDDVDGAGESESESGGSSEEDEES